MLLAETLALLVTFHKSLQLCMTEKMLNTLISKQQLSIIESENQAYTSTTHSLTTAEGLLADSLHLLQHETLKF